MGRHASRDTDPAPPPPDAVPEPAAADLAALPGWCLFATGVAAGCVWWADGRAWLPAAAVTCLGLVCTALLVWTARRTATPARRSRRHRAGHRVE